MTGQQRLRQPAPPPAAPDDLSAVVARLADVIDALNLTVSDPEDGLKARISKIETRVIKNEGSLDVVLRAFRLGEDHGGGDRRRIVGMTPVQLALGVFGSAMGVIATIQVTAPAIAAFWRELAHAVMAHATAAG